jgi:type I site-specific restriction endonuclease
MAKLKTFEEYVESLDRAEEIEKDTVAMGEPEEQGEGEEVVTADQPEADVPEGDEDNGAGEEVEDMDADTEEVYSEDDKETEEGDQEAPEDEGEEGAKEVTESEEENEDEVETQIADDEEEHEAEESPEEEESEEGEESEEAEAPVTVEEMVKELYEKVKSEAKVWENDMHDTHTIESYLKENAALMAMMAANALKESKEDITQEAYEAACNGLKESYSKKIDEMMEAWDSEGEEVEQA